MKSLIMPLVTFMVTLMAIPTSAQYALSVNKSVESISFSSNIPGEAQSTVVPPGKKRQCLAGRFVVTNDSRRPPDPRSVVSRSLIDSSAAATQTAFDAIPLPASDYSFGTRDNDIVTMPNGDMVLVWGVHLRSPLNPKPAWFDVTYSDPVSPAKSFGPGVRRGVMTWRSTDCGQSFQYMSLFDPAASGDGSCAFPQFGDTRFWEKPPYKNGGADGQLLKLDGATNRLYLTFPCVGQKPDVSKASFTLTTARLDKTLVLMSSDEGANWQLLGELPENSWRFGVVPLNKDKLAFGAGSLWFGQKLANGSYQFNNNDVEAPEGDWGWEGSVTPGKTPAADVIWAWVWAHSIVSRVPGSDQILFTFPDTVPDKNGAPAHGYRLFFYDPDKPQWWKAEPIIPTDSGLSNFIFHLAAIDLGSGPILVYWYEVNGRTKTATVRGRLITGPGEYTEDFAISRQIPDIGVAGSSVVRYFSLGDSKRWHGDYLTAGGYIETSPNLSPNLFHYYPMWVEPADKAVRYTRVTATRVISTQPPDDFTVIKFRPQPNWLPPPPPRTTERRIRTAAEIRDILGYGRHSGTRSQP